jgi:hypothetical protein
MSSRRAWRELRPGVARSASPQVCRRCGKPIGTSSVVERFASGGGLDWVEHLHCPKQPKTDWLAPWRLP